jgi:hypothetical protein
MTEHGDRLHDRHAKMLEESGITPEHARARGYVSIDGNNRKRLEEIKIVKSVQKSDGLLIPLLNIQGEIGGWQFRPDNPRIKDGKEIKYETPYRQPNMIDFPPGVAERLADRSIPVWFTEGVKKDDAGYLAGLGIVGLTGTWNWLRDGGALPDFRDLALKNREVILCFDSDITIKDGVWKAVRDLGEWLKVSRHADVKYCLLPHNGDGKTGLDDYLAAGHTLDELWALVRPDPPELTEPLKPDKPLEADLELPPPRTLEELHDTFRKWLGDGYDSEAMTAVLAAAAVERLDGDPLWLFLISGSGNAKTEMVQPLTGAGAIMTSTIPSEGALLSGTRQQERAEDATGGLLLRLGSRGVLVIKDVTSILTNSGDHRGKVLSALREIYDGRWDRSMGVDGGRTLRWAGRIAVIGAVTTAWDRAHDVVAAMGDRFVLIRTDSGNKATRISAGRQAISNTGSEAEMRAELAQVVGGVLAGMSRDVPRPTGWEAERLLSAADLVTRARTAVDFDWRGEVVDAHAPEMPTRFAKQLGQVVRGAVALGVPRLDALRLAIRCARDSIPPLRRIIIDDVAKHPGSTASDVRKRTGKPWTTIDRQLKALHMLEVLDCDEVAYGEKEEKHRWLYSLADGINPDALDPDSISESAPDSAPPPHREMSDSPTDEDTSLFPYVGIAKSGEDSRGILHKPATSATSATPGGEPVAAVADKSEGTRTGDDVFVWPAPHSCQHCGKQLWPDESCSACSRSA